MGEPSRWAVAKSSLSLRSLYPFVLHALADVPAAKRPGFVVADLPAGEGVLTYPLAAAGFDVRPLDLFDEYLERRRPQFEGRPAHEVFSTLADGEPMPPWLRHRLFGDPRTAPVPAGIRCARADMEAALPLPDASVDALVCVEGIEHVVDRHRVLAEFRRVVKPDGRLIITTPNLLSARARLAFGLTGQRALRSYIDEHTSVWGVSADGSRVYHGHAFLLSYFQLRYSLHHCGFRIRRLWPSNWSPTSLALWPAAWPLVWLFTRRTQRRAKAKFNKRLAPLGVSPPYQEMLRHLLSPELLLNATLIIEAEPIAPLSNADRARLYAG